MSETRPDPDALLRRVQAEEKRRGRGRLKVFFGASPGVGKTYAMLESARARAAEGREVVIGWVETHGRAETARLVEGLPRLPPRELEYRGVRLAEFDLDAALARRPALLLLDELAHTNAPGSRHARRFQDVEELLEAGIDVHTTLNVQHLESLNDVVAQITGVVQRETVPDRLLDEADEVEFVDLPAEDLEKRLHEGKVYVPEQAARAVHRFFRRGNLLALRELALRRTALHVDRDVRAYRADHAIQRTWPVAERVLVCVRPNPESERLVRAAGRMALGLRAEWIVVSVESPSQPPLSARERELLAGIHKLAEELGAETAVLSGERVAPTLLAFARERNASRLVVGKPHHPRWRDRLRGSLVDELVRGSGELDVHIISGEARAPGAAPGPAPARRPADRVGYAWAAAVVLGCTLVCAAMFGHFDNSNLIMVYLLGVAFVATRHGRGPSVLTAVAGVACFDFFFVPPHLTFDVADTQYFVTFFVMLVVSLLLSNLSVRVRAQAEAAREREQRTQVLYALSRELAAARSVADVGAAVARRVGSLLRGSATVLVPAEGGLRVIDGPDLLLHEAAVAQWAFEHGRPAGLGTDTLPGAAAVYLPLEGAGGVQGVLGVSPDPALLPLHPDQLTLLATLARLAASGLERARLAEQAEQARVAVEAERLRSTLLASVSHDLRTPLSAIAGSASTLLGEDALPEPARRELTQAIHDEAFRLNRLVTNLLDMTRLESGAVVLERDWHSLEELVGAALGRLGRSTEGRPVEIEIAPDLPLVSGDGVLLEQVFVNLIENALKYGAGAIRIAATAEATLLRVCVEDDGPGLPEGAEERVFEKFHRGTRGGRGFGLGLPICRAIVVAHGGRMWARRREPRGAAFEFTLPRLTPPPLPEAAA
jgi:two-component system sensor histidine kinase KdpD